MNKVILTGEGEEILSFLIDADTDRTIEIHKDPALPSIQVQVGDIYIGRVEKLMPSLHAAFVRIGHAVPACYLALEDAASVLYVKKGSGKSLQAGDELLVQVRREAMKGKAPAVTCALSLRGQFLVLSSGRGEAGVSRKLEKGLREQIREKAALLLADLQETLRDLLAGRDHIPDAFRTVDILVRTGAGEASWEMVQQEAGALLETYAGLIKNASHRTVYSCLHQSPPRFLERLSSLRCEETEKIVTDRQLLYEQILSYVKEHIPQMTDRVCLYTDSEYPMDLLYSLRKRKHEAQSRTVLLKSGAYLVIEPTEAMTVIDVNSGKAVAGKRRAVKEEEILKINLEAAQEICRQIRLRNLSGIVIVDFINMEEEASRKEISARMSALLKLDPVQADVIDYTRLGLMEITRKKIEKPIDKTI